MHDMGYGKAKKELVGGDSKVMYEVKLSMRCVTFGRIVLA